MAKKLTKTQRIMSVIIGLIAGAWTGWIINTTLSNYDLTFPFSLPILIIVSAVVLGASGYKLPRTTEVLIAGLIVSLIIIGGGWDLIINDFSKLRAIVMLSGIGILIIDVFLGSITVFDLFKISKRLFGGK